MKAERADGTLRHTKEEAENSFSGRCISCAKGFHRNELPRGLSERLGHTDTKESLQGRLIM